jgi:hypothetical protein
MATTKRRISSRAKRKGAAGANSGELKYPQMWHLTWVNARKKSVANVSRKRTQRLRGAIGSSHPTSQRRAAVGSANQNTLSAIKRSANRHCILVATAHSADTARKKFK